jgi:hypothetical protein
MRFIARVETLAHLKRFIRLQMREINDLRQLITHLEGFASLMPWLPAWCPSGRAEFRGPCGALLPDVTI